MKVYIHALNSCGMRNVKIKQYCDFLIANNHEIVSSPELADKILIWTCAFRQDVRDNSISEIIHYAEEYFDKVVVAGCLPDINRKLLNENFCGYIVNWKEDDKKLEKIFSAPVKKLSEVKRTFVKPQIYSDAEIFKKENPDKDAPYIGRFIQLYISEGCKFECTYCSERLAFPPYQSFPEDEIIDQCREEVYRSGKNKIVLLADDVGDYGCDIGTTLPNLIYHLRSINPDLRFALQGLNPYYFLKFYNDIIYLLYRDFIIHLQIPFQSASDRILKLMRRPYARVDIDKIFSFFNLIRFKDFDTHIIVGFPGETEEDFNESLQFIMKYQPKYVLINGFMEAPGMEAAKLPDKVNPLVIQQRIMRAVENFKSIGIICNYDNSELSKERFNRLNRRE